MPSVECRRCFPPLYCFRVHFLWGPRSLHCESILLPLPTTASSSISVSSNSESESDMLSISLISKVWNVESSLLLRCLPFLFVSPQLFDCRFREQHLLSLFFVSFYFVSPYAVVTAMTTTMILMILQYYVLNNKNTPTNSQKIKDCDYITATTSNSWKRQCMRTVGFKLTILQYFTLASGITIELNPRLMKNKGTHKKDG